MANDADASILAELAVLLSPLVNQPRLTLSAESTAADVDGWDSLVMLKFMFAIEKRFDVQFKSREMDRFQCVGDLVEALRARRGDAYTKAS